MDVLPTVTIEFVPDPDLGGFTAHISDIPAYGEGETEEEALIDLKVGIQLFVEENGIGTALARINSPSVLRKVDFGDLVAYE